MIRYFCDRCGECIIDNQYCTGHRAQLEGSGKDGKTWPWVIDINIKCSRPSWMLCKLCAFELILEAVSPLRDDSEKTETS